MHRFFFFVQGQCFLHTISRKLQYRTVHPVDSRGAPNMQSHIERTIQLYHNRGFVVTTIIADKEFECIGPILNNIHLDPVPPEEHVGEVERSVRTIKERVRATAHGLPFTQLPRILIRELVIFSVNSLNQLPADDGLSEFMSPQVIMTGRNNMDYNNLKIEFGSYAQISLNGSTDKYGHYSSPFANRSSDSYICSRKNSVRFLNSQDVNKGNCRVDFLKSAEYDPRYTKNQQGQTHKKWPLSLFALFRH